MLRKRVTNFFGAFKFMSCSCSLGFYRESSAKNNLIVFIKLSKLNCVKS